MRGDLVSLKKNNASVILQLRLFLLYSRVYLLSLVKTNGKSRHGEHPFRILPKLI
jgi:hypothetical protein